MRINKKEITTIADALLLQYVVYVHKLSGWWLRFPTTVYAHLPAGKKNQWLSFLKVESEYLRINPPPTASVFIRDLQSYFITYAFHLIPESSELEKLVSDANDTGDDLPFLKKINQLGLLQEWLQFEKDAYCKYVQAQIYPYEEAFLSIQ